MSRVFCPAWGAAGTAVTNATSATTAVDLPPRMDEVALTNTSLTAIVYVMVTPYLDEATVPTGTAPTAGEGFPILPATQIRLHVGFGNKVIRTLASAADGALIINPGVGI